ncbi:MAG: substrate-binding domain-containing protein [Lachnospiraceae bacterium]|nr:substrate-binding domain-containing protein [Lachnospiraceae bacterium]
MKREYRKSFCVLLFLCPLLLSGCMKQTSEQDASEEYKEEAIQIGITFDSFIIERWQRDRDVFVSAAQELGAEVNVQNANGDMKEQIAQIDYFIQKKMDAIVIVMVASEDDGSGLTEAVERAQRAGIPVVAYDRLILDANVDLYISFDNVQVGRLMGEHMREHLEEGGELLQVCGPMADYNVPQVMEGFEEALAGSGLEVMETAYAEGWLGETGAAATSKYLKEHYDVDGIMCGNDNIAGNAVHALSERRMAGSVCVVGQDADLDACQRIVEGTQCMTVYKPVEKLARRAAELSVALAEGEKIAVAGSGTMILTQDTSGSGTVSVAEAPKGEQTGITVTESIHDGTYQVPYEHLEPVAVTRENMDEVITGKYHEESDIYLNVRN